MLARLMSLYGERFTSVNAKLARAVVVAGVLALALTGCGAKSGGGTTAGATTAAAATK